MYVERERGRERGRVLENICFKWERTVKENDLANICGFSILVTFILLELLNLYRPLTWTPLLHY